MTSRLVTPPAATPVSLEDAKAHLRVDHSDQDSLITALIEAATGHIEDMTGRVFITQTWEMALDAFPESEVPLSPVPVQSIESVMYDDVDGYEATIAPDSYDVDTLGTTAWLYAAGVDGWPTALDTYNAVRIRYVAGYGDEPESVPAAIRHAIKLLVGHWYANAELVTDKQGAPLPFGVDALVKPYRIFA